MNDNLIILVSGVSGVGKTKLCRQFVADHRRANVNYINPGKVAAKLMYPSQVHLCKYMYTHMLARHSLSIIDGHIYLPTGPVPFDAIAELKICGIIVLHNNPATIEAYRISDTTKGRGHNAQKSIKEDQDKEIKHAHNVSNELDIRVKMVNSSNYELFFSAMEEMLNL